MLLPLILPAGPAAAQPRESDASGQEGRGYHAGSTLAEHEDFAEVGPMASAEAQPSGVPGIDVSNWQGDIDWAAVAADGIEFAYIKATGGTGFIDQRFDDNYVGAYNAGIIRGAYHFARPNHSGPIRQARFFVRNGGDWSPDGMTLPPMVDMEYNPSGPDCYGLSHAQMVGWVRGFSNEVKRLTGRYPVIYTTTNWWKMCTGNSGALNETNPLMIANWDDDPEPLPNWPYHTIWQYTASGQVNGIEGNVDRDSFNGSYAQLERFARAGPITRHWVALGGADSFLGMPVSGVYPIAGGKARHYEGGRIYYSRATGAHEVHGAILSRYLRLDGPNGPLGFPTRDERSTPDGVGRYSHFAGSGGSSIYWTPDTGAHEVRGAIHDRWRRLGWERGPMGYPVTDERSTPDGIGRYNHFSKNASIYWTSRTGAWSTRGAIRTKWASLGWERGRLGYPTSNEYAVSGGRGNDYEHGSIYWDRSSGDTRVVYR